MTGDQQTLRKLFFPAAVVAAGAALSVALTKGRKRLRATSPVNHLADLGTQVESALGNAVKSRAARQQPNSRAAREHRNSDRQIDPAELQARQRERAERRKRRRQTTQT